MGPTSSLSLKRPKSPCASSPTCTTTSQRVLGPIKTLSFQAFAHHGLPNLAQVGYALENGGSSTLVTLPLLQCSPPPSSKCMEPEIKGKGVIDLNKTAEVIQERDFLKQLQGPITTTTSRVISPQPVRPVCSKINVAYINPQTNPSPASQTSKKSPKEVEEEVESDDLPTVITDSNNRVRLVNSAYKEMMGQPECSWLDSMVRGKRICGEVMINFCESKIPVMTENNGFSCWVRIEWGREGKDEYMHAFCDVTKLACDSKDYVFTWRFHTTTDCREACHSSCNA